MAVTNEQAGTGTHHRQLLKSYETSVANTALTIATPTDRDRVRRLVAVLVAYSASVTQNVTVTYDASHGAAYDTLIQTIALSAVADGSWIPDEALLIAPGDAISVAAPAGGASVTCSLTVLTEEV